MRKILIMTAALVGLSACGYSGQPLANRGDEPHQFPVWSASGGNLFSTGGYNGYCNPTTIKDCGGLSDRAAIQQAAKDGTLRFIDRNGVIEAYKAK